MLSETEKYKLSIYNEVELLQSKNNCDIYLTKSSIDNKLYIKRVYHNCNKKQLFDEIMQKDISHIPKIFAVCYDDKNTIIIEEYIVGYTSDSISLNKKQLIRLIKSICLCLDELHSINIIHRDIKPSNIMINAENEVFLIDYGIARFYSESLDSDTTLLGTREFAAPEQFGFRQTDSKSDIFSMGKTIELLIKANGIKLNIKKTLSKATSFDPKNRFSSHKSLYLSLLCEMYVLPIIIFICAVMVLIFIASFIAFNWAKVTDKTANNINTSEGPTQTTTEMPIHSDEKSVTVEEGIIKADNIEQGTAQTPDKSSKLINIHFFNKDDEKDLFSGYIPPQGTYCLSLNNKETERTGMLTINDKRITVKCVKNGSKLNVDINTDDGGLISVSSEITKEMIEKTGYPDFNFYNAYIFFMDYDSDGDTDIIITFNTSSWAKFENGDKTPSGDEPAIILKNCYTIKAIEYTENGFVVCDDKTSDIIAP